MNIILLYIIMQITCAIIYYKGKILLVKKARGEHIGTYEFPGGKREDVDKTLQKSLEREVFEELGCHCDIYELIYFMHLDHLDIFFYNVELLSYEFTLSDEHPEYIWTTIDDAYNLKLNKEDYKVLKYLKYYFKEKYFT